MRPMRPMRPMRGFASEQLFSKSANSIFKIPLDCLFWKDDFENWFIKKLFHNEDKNVTKTLQCLKLKNERVMK